MPFGPGAPVEVTSSGGSVTVFVAPADPVSGSAGDAEFIKVGKAPLTFQLPPGVYRLDVQGIGISHGSMLLSMRSEPKRLLVRTGSEGLGDTGTLFIAVGITAILAATGILISGSKAPSSLDKSAVLIPVYAAGGVLLGSGIGMTIAASTNIDDRSAAPVPPPNMGRAPGLFARISF